MHCTARKTTTPVKSSLTQWMHSEWNNGVLHLQSWKGKSNSINYFVFFSSTTANFFLSELKIGRCWWNGMVWWVQNATIIGGVNNVIIVDDGLGWNYRFMCLSLCLSNCPFVSPSACMKMKVKFYYLIFVVFVFCFIIMVFFHLYIHIWESFRKAL